MLEIQNKARGSDKQKFWLRALIGEENTKIRVPIVKNIINARKENKIDVDEFTIMIFSALFCSNDDRQKIINKLN